MKDYVMIYTGNDKFMATMNIKTTNEQLPDSEFARVNKSYIINANFIETIGHVYLSPKVVDTL